MFPKPPLVKTGIIHFKSTVRTNEAPIFLSIYVLQSVHFTLYPRSFLSCLGKTNYKTLQQKSCLEATAGSSPQTEDHRKGHKVVIQYWEVTRTAREGRRSLQKDTIYQEIISYSRSLSFNTMWIGSLWVSLNTFHISNHFYFYSATEI